MASSTPASKSGRNRPFTVIVEGNIGCGKTTFLNYFNQFSDVCVLAEPIHMWRDCKGHNLFAKMYEDPKKWSFTFQSYVQLTMLQHHTFPTRHPIKLIERSIYSSRYCFVEKMQRDGLLPKEGVSVMDEWFKYTREICDLSVDLIVYLRSTPEVVYNRMMSRNRSEERSVPLEYLKQLHDYHENWLHYKSMFSCPAPVVTVDADLDKSIIHQEYIRCQPHILNRFAVETRV